MNTTLNEPKSLKDLVCTAESLSEALKNLLDKDHTSLTPVMEVIA